MQNISRTGMHENTIEWVKLLEIFRDKIDEFKRN